MFANMSLVASILSATNLRALDGRNWDGRVFSLFPSCMMLTYTLWTLIGVLFSLGIFYKKYKTLKEENKQSCQLEEDEEGAYQRQSDEEEADANEQCSSAADGGSLS